MLFGRSSELVIGRVMPGQCTASVEFDRVDISEGVDDMHDEDIFEAEEVMDESNI